MAWFPDEATHAGPEHFDAAYVADYDAKSRVDVGAALELLRRHGLEAGATLVDLGCGTGVLATAAASEARRVVGVDVSPPMLEVARSRSGAVEWVEAGLLTYEHEGDPPRLVHCRHALHHLPDFWKGVALARIRELLEPGGTFVLGDLVYDFEPAEAERGIEDWLAAAAPTSAAGWTRAERETHVRNEHSTFAWLLETLLVHAGFEIAERHVRGGIYATYVCTRP